MTPDTTDDDPPITSLSAIDRLHQSISNLWEEFGSTDSPLFGLVVNGGLASIGVVVAVSTTGVIQFIAGVWAILNLLGIIAWVLRL